jgi:hypothetical protein
MLPVSASNCCRSTAMAAAWERTAACLPPQTRTQKKRSIHMTWRICVARSMDSGDVGIVCRLSSPLWPPAQPAAAPTLAPLPPTAAGAMQRHGKTQRPGPSTLPPSRPQSPHRCVGTGLGSAGTLAAGPLQPGCDLPGARERMNKDMGGTGNARQLHERHTSCGESYRMVPQGNQTE